MADTPIKRAQAFLLQQVIEPALAHPTLSEDIKARVRNSRRWIERFTKVGDLLVYLQRFKGETSRDTFTALKGQKLLTFEDLLPKFESRFSVWANDRSTPESFIIGEKYDSFQILIFAGAYDTRAGGMFVLGDRAKPEAAVIKATLTGGRYPNEWLEEGQRLKYFLKSRDGDFGEHFQENAAILEHPELPILCFVREHELGKFVYEGIFSYDGITREISGVKWFTLERQISVPEIRGVSDLQYEEERLGEQVRAASKLTKAQLDEKLAQSSNKPKRIILQTSGFARNPYVIAAALERAKGVCENCGKAAPFTRATDGSPFLEVHHRVFLAANGDDSLENALALCPNCHRKMHFG